MLQLFKRKKMTILDRIFSGSRRHKRGSLRRISCHRITTHVNVFAKEINHVRTCSQYFNQKCYCENCQRVVSVMPCTFMHSHSMKTGLETRQSQRTSVLSSIITWGYVGAS